MQFESFRRPPPTLNLSALIDIVFILLIFVVLAANFDRLKDIEVTLPSARATSKADPKALTVTIPADGPVKVDGEAVESARLADHLRTMRSSHQALLLVADGAVALERAVEVLGEASQAGFTAVSIATREPSP